MINGIDKIVEYIKKEANRHSIMHRFSNIVMNVYSNELVAIQWLENYHVGYFSKCVENSPDIVLCGLYVEEEIYEMILSFFPFKKKILMFFEHEGYEIEDKEYRVFYDVQSQYIHIVQNEYHYVVVLKKGVDNFRIIERIEKELFFCAMSGTHIRVHAAAICDDKDVGSLVVGAKGRGKTTLALGAMIHGAKFGANDRTEVYKDAQGMLKYCGVPTSVRLSREQEKYVQEILGKNIKPILFSDLAVYKNKVEYAPQEVSQYFNSQIVNNAVLKNILIPQFGFESIKITEMKDKKNIYEILRENVFDVDKAFVAYFSSSNNRDLEELLAQMIKNLKCYIVEGWLYDFDLKMIE